MREEQMFETYQSSYFSCGIDNEGNLSSLRGIEDRAEYLVTPRPVVQISVDGVLHKPSACERAGDSGRLRFIYGDLASLELTVRAKPSHVSFVLSHVVGVWPELIIWGGYETSVTGVVGETVGVADNGTVAVGIQALNIQTIGGWPKELPGVGRSDDTAVTTDDGVEFRAFSRDEDGGIINSSIALFACPATNALDTIGSIELAEGLPHPMLDGEWCKASQTARGSYLITSFGEESVEEAINYAREAGFRYLYHEDPFDNWGHFTLRSTDFPSGDDGLDRCVKAATSEGLRVGLHTLSNFVTTNDPFVTPVPDSRLMRSGASVLAESVSAESSEIEVDDPASFLDRGSVATAVIGSELVRYRAATQEAPWKLLGCRRGAFGTAASSHEAGDEIGKLADHPYRVFFPDIDLQDVLADRLIDLFNKTGIRQISFDGLEGCEMTGHGLYSLNRFVSRCFDGWGEEILNDASRLTHYLWHTHTRMNWGEPWGKATREGQIGQRLVNQDYFKRNLFPRMFGWFQLRLASTGLEATSLDDMEWVLSKCAGYDSGFALSARLDALKANGQTPAILEAIRTWEGARLSNAFSQQQVERLREPGNDFHLEDKGDGTWQLLPISYSEVFSYQEVLLQPGEPGEAEWGVNNPYSTQPLEFTVRVLPDISGVTAGDPVTPVFEVNFEELTLPVRLAPNQYLECDGTGQCTVFDLNWNPVEKVSYSGVWPRLDSGDNQMSLWYGSPSTSRVEVRFKSAGPVESVGVQ